MSRRRGRVSEDVNGGSIPFSRAPKEPVSLDEVAVLLDPEDDVAIAKAQLAPGTVLVLSEGGTVRVGQAIPSGHKVALRAIPAGRGRASLRPGDRRGHPGRRVG